MKLLWYDSTSTERVLHDSRRDVFCGPCQIMVDREDGFGMPPVRYETETGPYQHGATVKVMRWQPRILRLGVKMYGHYDDLLAARQEFASWFNYDLFLSGFPNITLIRDAGWQRGIHCLYSGGLEFGMLAEDINEIRLDVELFAPDPFFIQPNMSYFVFPNATGASYSETSTIQNVGDWYLYPGFVFHGPATNPKIENLSTAEELELTYTIGAGDYVSFGLHPHNRGIVSGLSGNLAGYLTQASDFATFHFAAYNEKANGNNNIRVSCTGATGATYVRVYWYPVYLTA